MPADCGAGAVDNEAGVPACLCSLLWMNDDPLHGLTILERGWLSSNNVLVHAASGEAGAWLVDTSHVNHAAQTLALVQHALAGRPLAAIANTHLHSDHCGGNALLQQVFGAPDHGIGYLLKAQRGRKRRQSLLWHCVAE